MPELPEVEVVRRGLRQWAAYRVVSTVQVLRARSVRRHTAGSEDFAARLVGRRFGVAERRGKYLWLPLDAGHRASDAGPHGAQGSAATAATGTPVGETLTVHLGMSGQLRLQPEDAPDEPHVRVRIRFRDHGPELRFVDQRTFGGMAVEPAVPAVPAAPIHARPDGVADTERVPASVAHIARDPLDPAFDEQAFHDALRKRHSELKRALLDQSLVSGVGNIYADEALWRAGLHHQRRTDTLGRPRALQLLDEVRAVMRAALDAGGTSFDSLYVNVNGESGYFERSLNVYGREGEPCRRCGTRVRRSPFMNRSSYFCPRCQPRPRQSVAATRRAPGVASGAPSRSRR